ncbi:hypothetical protein X751_31670 [Mesorhizobium sp. LNJC395A00]|nr:hypothetical protein X751_31670 [Mesorhizobium sp. LNJC395A00]
MAQLQSSLCRDDCLRVLAILVEIEHLKIKSICLIERRLGLRVGNVYQRQPTAQSDDHN